MCLVNRKEAENKEEIRVKRSPWGFGKLDFRNEGSKSAQSHLINEIETDSIDLSRLDQTFLNSAAPSELRDEDFILKYSELKECLEAKNLSGSELSYVEMLILQKIQARFREYYNRTEPVDSYVAALAKRARLFLNSQ